MKQTMSLTLAGCLALGLLGCEPDVSDAHPRVHIEYEARVNGNNGLDYVLAEGTMSGTVRDGGSYTVPVQIYYPTENGNGTAILELTNSALLFCHLGSRGDRAGDRRSDADNVDELEKMQVNFGLAGAREYLLRNGFTHMAIQWNKMVTDFMGEALPVGRDRRRLGYGRIEKAADGYEITRDAARWLRNTGTLTGDAPPVQSHDHVIAYGLSQSGYFLRNYLIRDENAGQEIDGFFLHTAGSMCWDLIDDDADCPEGSTCVGAPRFFHWFLNEGAPPTNGAKVLAVDAQSDLEFNAGALARQDGGTVDPDYVRWEVAGAPHVPVFAMDLTRLGAVHQNTMDWSPIWRSAFHYLDTWVKEGTAPPPSGPFIEGQMVATEDGPVWKPELDGDGNALGGIRLPEIEAPLGVYTGFDFSWLDPAVAEGYPCPIVFAFGGRFKQFSDEELAKRYPTNAAYREVFAAAVRKAFDAGYILEEDLRSYTDHPPQLPRLQSGDEGE
jgi:hypothetical protein